jgi:hypothetical protein
MPQPGTHAFFDMSAQAYGSPSLMGHHLSWGTISQMGHHLSCMKEVESMRPNRHGRVQND